MKLSIRYKKVLLINMLVFNSQKILQFINVYLYVPLLLNTNKASF